MRLPIGHATIRVAAITANAAGPVTKVVVIGTSVEPEGDCDSNYSPCVPIASDVDCAGGGGDGPEYVSGPVRIVGDDPYRLVRDGDRLACDS